jgi:hypothetical protein
VTILPDVQQSFIGEGAENLKRTFLSGQVVIREIDKGYNEVESGCIVINVEHSFRMTPFSA